jgi:SAM-dependent methyltransferase
MNERDYHDRHYAAEAAMIEGSVLFRRVHDRAARHFLRATAISRAQRLLSLGCGGGAIECQLALHVGEIVGTDISSVAIAQAKARAAAAGLRNVSFAVADQAAGEPGRFDAVAAFAFLHHLDDAAIRATLVSARKALRAGGIFYSADPSRRRLVGLFRGFVAKTYERYHSPDERELSPATLATLAAEAGFSRCAIGYTDYFLGPLAWLAPGTPRWLAGPLEALDNLALSAPLARRYASSFSLLAHAPA